MIFAALILFKKGPISRARGKTAFETHREYRVKIES
jgi:hypothetical protein